MSEKDDSDEDNALVTSLSCQWKHPRKRKASTMETSAAEFQKHEYGKDRKYKVQALEDFDPRPVEMRNTVTDRVPQLLADVKGKGLCISLLLDPTVCVETSGPRCDVWTLSITCNENRASYKGRVIQEEVRSVGRCP